MFKPLATLLVLLVICSHSILLASCSEDDEFAEFDDFVPKQQQQAPVNPSSKASQQASSTAKPVGGNSADPGHKLEGHHQEEAKRSEPKGNKNNDDFLDNAGMKEEDRQQEQQKKKPDLKLVDAPLPRVYKIESYYIEFAFILASLLYFVNYFVGSGKNHNFAQNWYERARDGLKLEFALVGGSPQLNDGKKGEDGDGDSNSPSSSTNKKQKGLIKSTESMYTLWSSGRTGMDGLLVEINLIKRHDLFSMALNLLKPAKDCIVLRFLLNNEGYDNFVFCLAHKTQAAKLARDMVDINTFCPKKKPASQCGVESEKLFVMSELSDVASFILDQRTASFIKRYEQAINYVHITDQYSTLRSEDILPAQKLANPKRMATFSFAFPMKTDDWHEYISFSLNLLDRLRRFKLAKDSKQKSEKNRQKIKDILQKTAFSQRQEAAQAKKEELRRLEKERIYNEDDPEKQIRWEKKEAKRELKKNKMRVKQLKVKSM